jgi:AraC-like DNA-binding protein
VSTVLLDTEDIGEAETALRRLYSSVALARDPAGSRAPVRSRIVRTELGVMSVDDIRIGFDYTFEGESSDTIFVSRILDGVVESSRGDRGTDVFRAGDAVVLGIDATIPLAGSAHGSQRYVTVGMPRQVFGEIASGPGLSAATDVRLTERSAVSTEANAYMVKLVDYVVKVALDPIAVSSPLIAGAVMQHLAETMLVTYRSTASLDPTVEDRRDSTPAVLRKAVAFIDDNAQLDLPMPMIAEAVHVTPRALQYLFRKYRDCTPVEYIRRVRLNHAYRELVSGNRGSTTVARVAANWGFAHVGRFAVYYREQYGESPHETLRR